MKSPICFLIAAKRSEIAGLRQLALTSALVEAMRQFTYALQRERDLSNHIPQRWSRRETAGLYIT